MNDKIYYFNNEWVTWDALHAEGYTKRPAANITVYNSSNVAYNLMQDTFDNTLYDANLKIWVDDIDHFNLYKYVDDFTIYIASVETTVSGYSNSLINNNVSHVLYKSQIKSLDDLYNNEGITTYPCAVYTIDKGIITSWYDETNNLYWDNSKNQWQDTPPIVITYPDDGYVRPNPTCMEFVPQWEDDLSQVPTYYRAHPYPEQDEYLNTQSEFMSGYNLISQFPDYTNITSDLFYPDTLTTNVIYYIVNEDGFDSQSGEHYDYGDKIAVDTLKVYVDADGEVILYKDTTPKVFYLTHDELHDVEYYDPSNNEIKLYQYLINDGYSATPSSGTVFVSDTNIEFNIKNIYEGYYNSSNGYYINNKWYSNISELNSAGYYIVEKQIKTIYGGYIGNYDYAKTSGSTTFNTNYKSSYYNDANKTDPLLWDGHNWILDTDNAYYKNNLSLLSPTTLSSNYSVLIQLITASGNPLNPYVESELGTQLYIYFATDKNGSMSTSGNAYYNQINMYYWKLI